MQLTAPADTCTHSYVLQAMWCSLLACHSAKLLSATTMFHTKDHWAKRYTA
jgi:hypothetical protein